ncbi:MAG: VWA domain-containing protein [Acidobacteria bacterium]|nr:VWA domain-containing protein [Acidobacteriota bacterium]
MFFFNLSLGEFVALWSAVSGAALALYLLDRSRKKIKVASMRFWKPSERPPEAKHRKKIQQPWSLLMQIAGMGLLLAAVAQLRWGSPDRSSRDHVLLLDTSAWMAAREGQRRLIDEAKTNAIRWVRTLPGADRVMVVRADTLPTPATVFETNRTVVERAILESQPGAGALYLQGAFDFARRMQRQHGQSAGEVVFAGGSRGQALDLPAENTLPPALRLLPVKEPSRNVGIRRFQFRRVPSQARNWEVFLAVRNYGRAAEAVPLVVTFGNAPVGSGRLNIAAGAEETVRYEFATQAAGWAEAKLQVRDALPDDNQATVELPEQKPVRVTVLTREPNLLRPLMNANPRVAATYLPPEAYKADLDTDLLVIDRFKPGTLPKWSTLYIEPPSEGAPIAVARAGGAAKLTQWHVEHSIATGLRTLDLRLDRATVFKNSPNIETVAEVDGGTLIAASASAPRAVYLGFHPGAASLKFELAIPLLMANIFEWMAPEVFRRMEVNADSVGTVRVALEPGADARALQVLDEQGQPLPFSLSENTLQFYTGSRGLVRVRGNGRETVHSLSLPDAGDATWEAPARVRRGIGRGGLTDSPIRELWPWLALLGAALLLAEWLIYGRLKLPAQAASITPIDYLRRFVPPFRKAS